MPLNHLTILAGMNGAGKSSMIHALLLAKRASEATQDGSVPLSGIFGLELGSAEDVRNWDHSGDISVGLTSSSGRLATWTFSVGVPGSLYLGIASQPPGQLLEFLRAPRQFTFLSAERFGPRSVSIAMPVPVDEVELGIHGEHTAQLISLLGSQPLEHPERMHPTPHASSLLKYEIERWLREITRPVEIDVETFADPAVSRIRYRTDGGDWVRATNMGFGMSYSLPIVVGGLVAADAGILIIENPEAHLHPAGQSHVGRYLAWLAGKGVQVVLETHSDHVLNGIRLAIAEEHLLSHDDASILYFGEDNHGALNVHNLSFGPSGSVSDWPKGFFDQFQIDVASLGRLRRKS